MVENFKVAAYYFVSSVHMLNVRFMIKGRIIYCLQYGYVFC